MVYAIQSAEGPLLDRMPRFYLQGDEPELAQFKRRCTALALAGTADHNFDRLLGVGLIEDLNNPNNEITGYSAPAFLSVLRHERELHISRVETLVSKAAGGYLTSREVALELEDLGDGHSSLLSNEQFLLLNWNGEVAEVREDLQIQPEVYRGRKELHDVFGKDSVIARTALNLCVEDFVYCYQVVEISGRRIVAGGQRVAIGNYEAPTHPNDLVRFHEVQDFATN